MSLYNALHGVNAMTPMLLGFLGITHNDVPRFRDCWVEDGRIAIHTRTGGGNRNFYDCEERCRDNYPEYFNDENPPSGPWNADLRALPGYLYDEDDDFDSTYATFYYKPCEDIAALVQQLCEISPAEKPADKWRKLFADMEAGKDNPRVARALEVGAPILAQLTATLDAQAGVTRMGGDGEAGSGAAGPSTRSEGCAPTSSPKDSNHVD